MQLVIYLLQLTEWKIQLVHNLLPLVMEQKFLNKMWLLELVKQFIFPKRVNGNNNPIFKHCSVLFPRGTANDMANDQGRQW